MNIIKKIKSLFKKEKVNCPRCLGKGHVDKADIKRLKRELEWMPGECAFCSGSGKVNEKFKDNIKPDEAYLTIDLTEEEKEKFLNNDAGELFTAANQKASINLIKDKIIEMHLKQGLSISQISKNIIVTLEVKEEDHKEIEDFVSKVIELHKNES